MSDPGQTHVDDQLEGYYAALARRLALFHRELRAGGVSRPVAAVLTVMQLAGYHWPGSSER